jgi:hypothetical protein
MESQPLGAAVSGERFEFGGLSAYVAGRGAPLLLVHSVNAAASAAEVRPLFEHYSATRTVFAIDLPGFGHSRRADIAYTPRLMTDALHSHGRAGAPALRAQGRWTRWRCRWAASSWPARRPSSLQALGPPGAGQPHRLSGHPGLARRAGQHPRHAHAAPRC